MVKDIVKPEVLKDMAARRAKVSPIKGCRKVTESYLNEMLELVERIDGPLTSIKEKHIAEAQLRSEKGMGAAPEGTSIAERIASSRVKVEFAALEPLFRKDVGLLANVDQRFNPYCAAALTPASSSAGVQPYLPGGNNPRQAMRGLVKTLGDQQAEELNLMDEIEEPEALLAEVTLEARMLCDEWADGPMRITLQQESDIDDLLLMREDLQIPYVVEVSRDIAPEMHNYLRQRAEEEGLQLN